MRKSDYEFVCVVNDFVCVFHVANLLLFNSVATPRATPFEFLLLVNDSHCVCVYPIASCFLYIISALGRQNSW